MRLYCCCTPNILIFDFLLLLISKRLTFKWFVYLFSFDITNKLISVERGVELKRQLKSSGQSLSRDNTSRRHGSQDCGFYERVVGYKNGMPWPDMGT